MPEQRRIRIVDRIKRLDDLLLAHNKIKDMRKGLRIILGITLIILGVLAALTPFSPGSWLALIGLEILGLRILLQRKLLTLLPERYRQKVRSLFRKKRKIS
jgi:hypothetical protein